MPDNRPIRILGGGISGLAAAINLARQGVPVEVIDKREQLGSRYKGDFQGLENWTSSTDALDFLDQINIRRNFALEPFTETVWYDRKLTPYRLRSHRVGFYLIQRGAFEGCLDYGLVQQAREAGVVLKTGLREDVRNCDIIATGVKRPYLKAIGFNFRTSADKIALGIFDNAVAPGGYAYLLVVNGKATVAVVSKAHVRHLSAYLDGAIARFREIVDFNMESPIKFGGIGSRFVKLGSGRPKVGEAGGLQDAMWGFGIRAALLSGFLAAKATAEKRDYWEMVKKTIAPNCRSSVVNRFCYDIFGSLAYKYILKTLSDADDPVSSAQRLYRYSPLKGLLYPFASVIIGKGHKP